VKPSVDELPRNRRTSAFERRVGVVLDGSLSGDERVLVACSGGPDSVAALIATVRRRPSGTVSVGCFDHQLRPAAETEGDVRFVAEMATRLGGCFSSGVPEAVLAGDEGSAREARYGWLAAACEAQGAAVCVTGHTQDDQAETVLLRLTRGSGLRGAAGMRVRSPWPVEQPSGESLSVVRPLLGISRAEVEGYLEALGVEARLDPTNELVTYARNRVRRRVIPELEELNEGARRHLAAFAERAQLDSDALEAWAAREFAEHGTLEEGEVRLDRAALRQLSPAVTTRVVRIAARKLGLALTSEQLGGALKALERSGYEVSIEGGVLRSGPSEVSINQR
jgi:tRNA(Ile)-lysidine synthase